MKLQVIKNKAAQRMAHFPFSVSNSSTSVTMPAMQDFASALIRTLQDKFSAGDLGYTGAMGRGFKQKKLSQDVLVITQDATHSKFIRGGTQGPYKGFPAPLVDWGIRKKGSRREGFAVAKYIQKHGTANSFIGLFPHGARRFEYPEWAIRENKDELDKLVDELGIAMIEWITADKKWRRKFVV